MADRNWIFSPLMYLPHLIIRIISVQFNELHYSAAENRPVVDLSAKMQKKPQYSDSLLH